MSIGLTSAQLRAARGLLDWSQDTLAEKAGISASTIRTWERPLCAEIKASSANLQSVIAVLLAARIGFGFEAGQVQVWRRLELK